MITNSESKRELSKKEFRQIFTRSMFKDSRVYGALCHLLNEDYHDLLDRNIVRTDSAAEYLFERIDRALQIVGMDKVIVQLNSFLKMKSKFDSLLLLVDMRTAAPSRA